MNRPSIFSLVFSLYTHHVMGCRCSQARSCPYAATHGWSKSSTWEGSELPAAGSNVLIRTGHHVIYDVASDDAIRSVHIGGKLSFDPPETPNSSLA